MSIGSYLKGQRQFSGKIMKDIAEKLELSVSYVSQLENGGRLPSPKQFSSLARAYGLKEEELKKHWLDTKMGSVVGMAGTYKFKIEEAVERKAMEVQQSIERELSSLKGKFSQVRAVPLLATVPIKAKSMNEYLKRADRFIYLPTDEVAAPASHRLFAVKANFLEQPEAGVMASDLLILDPDAKPQTGDDLVLLATPKGLVLTFYNLRNGQLEMIMPRQIHSRFFRLNQVEVVGVVIYHIKKF